VNLRGWLTGIIVFLLMPSLIFATLWIRASLSEVQTLDRAIRGLTAIAQLGPLVEKRLTEPKALSPADTPSLSGLGLSEIERERTAATYQGFLQEPSVSRSIRYARDYIRTITTSVHLSAVTTPETVELPYLLSDHLPAVVYESAAMVYTGDRLARKATINLWDRMALPVQGGQFKVAADSIARISNDQFGLLSGNRGDRMRELGAEYRRANALFQSAGADLLMSTSRANTGSDIKAAKAMEMFPQLALASTALWAETLSYLSADLTERRDTTLFNVVLASVVGVLVIVAAFGLAALLSRALAERTQQEIDDLGFHDPLTGLPNRRGVMKRLDAEDNAASSTAAHGLIVADVRHFKAINSTHGEETGDGVLRDIAEDLKRFGQITDVVGRTGGTEFTLFRPHLQNGQEELRALAKQAVEALRRQRHIAGQSVSLDVCAGLATREGARCEDTMLEASLALKAAKRAGSSEIRLFEPLMRTEFDANASVAQKLMEALKGGEIVSWYQPQICTRTGRTVGAEALVRWVDRQDGVRYPGAFLPAAEEAGYMDLIDASVRSQALAMTSQYIGAKPSTFHIGINCSVALMAAPDCVERLLDAVHEAGLAPQNVSIEILEAVMIDAVAAEPIKANVAALSRLGFHIELDDFGTGHSSISSLRDLHVDRVKIDRSFISGVDSDPELQKFTSALIQLSKSLDISVLAEGVETEAELQWLTENGCDVVQGWLISKAVPKDEFLAKAHVFGAPLSNPAHQKTYANAQVAG